MSNIFHPDFSKPKNQARDPLANKSPTALVASLLKNSLPLHPGKMRVAKPEVQVFLDGLKHVDSVELHLSGDTIDHESFLMYVPDGEDLPRFLSLDEFLDLLIGEYDSMKRNLDELIPLLEEMFQRIGLYFEEIYYSPRNHMNSPIEGTWSPDLLFEASVVPGVYFYSIRTVDSSDEGISTGPEIIGDIGRSISLADLVASYLERTYEDSIKVYDDSTEVEIMKYDYLTGGTLVIILPYATLEGACISAILDQNPLLREFEDLGDIIELHLDRVLARKVEVSRVFDFPKK